MNVAQNLKLDFDRNNDGFVITFGNNAGHVDRDFDETLYEEISHLYNVMNNCDETDRNMKFSELVGAGRLENFLSILEKIQNGETLAPEKPLEPTDKARRGVQNLINFFTEFDFEPNFRFVNSIALQPTIGKKRAYITNYFRLLDNAYATDVENKMRSAEFEKILEDIASVTPTSRINNRLKVYYGSAGTGKTTLAQKESGGRCIVCNNSMFPSDIMEDFVFEAGQPSFNPSVFWDCMEKGLPIVLDEINLLPFDTLRFLQGLLDGKKTFNYKGRTVTIKDGFEVIGTMNLNIGGTVFGLPEPLVDRCYDFREFKLNADQLMEALK